MVEGYEKPLETMDDLRAAMESPEVKAADLEMSKRFLKNNRPKSLLVVALVVAAAFLLLGLSGHKASSVTPTALRTAETVLVRETQSQRALTAEQREELISLLDGVRVKRTDLDADTFEQSEHLVFTFEPHDMDDWFALSREGYLCVLNNCYALEGDAEALWQQAGEIIG